MIGRDTFHYVMGIDGKLFPQGSKDEVLFRGGQLPDLRDECVINRNGNFCAAYLAENGYNMNY